MDDTQINRPITPKVLFAGCMVAQVLLLPALWGHESDGQAVFLGRYSPFYMMALAAHLGLTLAWMAAYFWRERLMGLVGQMPRRLLVGAILFMSIAAFIVWIPGIESQLKSALSLNLLLANVVLIYAFRDDAPFSRGWVIAITTIVLLMLIPLAIHALTGNDYSPDEAHWADYATSPYVVGGLYSRTWLNEPVAILPGLGWGVAAYGWLLENVAFDIRVGRIWNMAAFALSFVGIWAVSWRLYGRRVAWVSVAIAILSAAFLPVLDYRPDHQLPMAMTFIIFTALQARYSGTQQQARIWHFLCGLSVTLSLQLHAAGFYFAAGMGLFYGVEAIMRWLTPPPNPLPEVKEGESFAPRVFQICLPLAIFAMGAAVGTGIYYVFNIAPVGGLQAFLTNLAQERFGGGRELYLTRLGWPSLLESILLVFGAAYLLWRRNRADRLLLGMVAAILVCVLLLDNWGYRTSYQAMAVIPIGILLARGLGGENRSGRGALLTFCLVTILAGQTLGENVSLKAVTSVIRNGKLPDFTNSLIGAAVAERITDADVLVTTHELIWTFQNRPNFYSMAAEKTAARRWNVMDEPEQVWERVGPTAIVHLEGRIALTPGLLTYMEQHDFGGCEVFSVGDVKVTLYRAGCVGSSSMIPKSVIVYPKIRLLS